MIVTLSHSKTSGSGSLRWAFIYVAVFYLTACTTTPPARNFSAIPNTLSLCGSSVSNAPAINRKKEIIGFQPFTEVSGVVLARAPVRSCLTSGFGPRKRRFHKGIDLFTKAPTPIYAGGDGVVEQITTKRGFGRTILIRHNKRVQTRYAHLSSYANGLKVGDKVKLGQTIGETGKSGNATAIHLHYEVLVKGVPKNPLTLGR